MKQKRGISSLVVSVILVGITVAAVTIVALWGGKFQENLQQKEGDLSQLSLDCSAVKFDVTSTASGAVTLENQGTIPLAGVIVVAKGNKGKVNSVVYTQPLAEGDSKSYPFANIPEIDPPIKSVSVIGAVGSGIYKPCSDQRMDVNL